MANIAVNKENQTRSAVPYQREWDPLRYMRDLVNWDPFREMSPYVPQAPTGFIPSFDVKETKDGYLFRADVPGVKESDIEVTLTGNRLTVSGKREFEKHEQSDTFYMFERSYGDFTRSFTLPEGIDANAVSADLKDGVLTLSLKRMPELQPKKIVVKSAAQKS
jgi:HSP20 family protein